MRIVKYEGTKIHAGCGGVVLGRICTKCGEEMPRRSIVDKILGDAPTVSKKGTRKVGRKEHKKRIRDGRDIFK